jgi:hypothetical protein
LFTLFHSSISLLRKVPAGCEFSIQHWQSLATSIVTHRVSYKKGRIRNFLCAVAIGVVISNTVLTTLQTSASMRNYPGGQAMILFDELYQNQSRGKPIWANAGILVNSYLYHLQCVSTYQTSQLKRGPRFSFKLTPHPTDPLSIHQPSQLTGFTTRLNFSPRESLPPQKI